MATIVLSAVGAAAGAAVGGNVLGLSSVVIGRAIGATVGNLIDRRLMDQKVMGTGSALVETGRLSRYRIQSASEGDPVADVYGRVRQAGQVVWATRFNETVTVTGGGTAGGGGTGGSGKGGRRSAPQSGRSAPAQKSYSYSVSLAVAVCHGEIAGIGRVWADGKELSRDAVTLRVYRGTEEQMPDPKIAAVQGADEAPAYRGIAYVVFEDLELGPFGNRVPQFSFEVLRPEQAGQPDPEIAHGTRAVALIPGTGEYSLATSPVYYDDGPGRTRPANMNTGAGAPDLSVSLDAMQRELPNCEAVSLVVSWFGDDLRCGSCALRPMVEHRASDGIGMPWSVSGTSRSSATAVPTEDGRPIYGGTPADQSVMQCIEEMRSRGLAVTFYPFILMTQMAGNGLTDPWTGEPGQPALPWRGRITTALAPGIDGSPDRSAAADSEVATFFGAAEPWHFTTSGSTVSYAGPAEWSYRRMILHYAHLCAAAGGVESFCIGSELRSLTQIRGVGDGFPAVQELIRLARDVRTILGPETKIGYAADWSEYFGYHPQDGSGDVYFHLDPLWADADIDFIGIDNYMPLSDWRDTREHADAHWGSIYDLDYLRQNVAGGEGYHWYYASDEDRAAQVRTPITDGAHGEHWVFRYKDLRGWWDNAHHDRIGGVRQATPTAWQPRTKPIWFMEIGCAAVDKGTNQPNKFLDPKSSESAVPHFSTGERDEFIQMQYLRATFSYWETAENNPVSDVYGGRMVDTARAHVWAWDARPYPYFPARGDVWSDGANYVLGHWINGRTANRSLAGVVQEICAKSGVTDIDVSRLYGLVRGYSVAETGTARAALQPLMLAYGFDAVERGGQVVFRSRTGRLDRAIADAEMALSEELDARIEATRGAEAEAAGRMRLLYTEADGDFGSRAEEAIYPDEATHGVAQSDLPLVLTRPEARRIVERWLAEARVAQDTVRFALPPSNFSTQAGDVVQLRTGAGMREFRIDRIEQAGAQLVEAVRTDGALFSGTPRIETTVPEVAAPEEAVPVMPVFLDLPLLTGAEAPHAPWVAVASEPWPGPVNVYRASADAGYGLLQTVESASVIGLTRNDLPAAVPGLVDRGPPLEVALVSGTLASAEFERVLNGANAAAIGDPASGIWEVFQFVEADLVAPGVYALGGRLRGQAGTDGVMPAVWPAGSTVVLLDGRPDQLDIPAADRGLERHYRVGPAAVGYDHPSYSHSVLAFAGAGLRPYAPVHLRAEKAADGSWTFGWIRRTRVDGDSWESFEVPLGEERQLFQLQIRAGGDLLRDEMVSVPAYSYDAAAQAADGVTGGFEVAVAQVSDRFGPGPFRRITIDG